MDNRILKRKGFKQVSKAEHSLVPRLQRDNPGPEIKESNIRYPGKTNQPQRWAHSTLNGDIEKADLHEN